MTRFLPILALAGFLLYGCSSDQLPDPMNNTLKRTLQATSPTGDYDHYILPETGDYDALPQDPSNPLSAKKVELGRMLFFETGLAQGALHPANQMTFSCSSCHIPERGFMPGRSQGIADGGVGFGENGELRDQSALYQEHELDVQGARALSLMNAAFVTNTSWSGQFGSFGVNEGTEHLWDLSELTEVNHLGLSGLEAQNIEGLKLHRLIVNEMVLDTFGYREYFDECFPDFEPEERYSELTASFAISAYLRSLVTDQAPFQEWLRGDQAAMTDGEKRGAMVFFGKAGCYRCHNGPSLNNAEEFHAIGVNDLYQREDSYATSVEDARNLGRGGFTQVASDMHKFKVPQLYNMKLTNFFFHGSSKQSLREVVEYFNEGIPENPDVPVENISPYFHPLQLNDQEVDDLVEFLTHSLYDPNFNRHVPEFTLSGNCYPNNDALSRFQIGCE